MKRKLGLRSNRSEVLILGSSKKQQTAVWSISNGLDIRMPACVSLTEGVIQFIFLIKSLTEY